MRGALANIGSSGGMLTVAGTVLLLIFVLPWTSSGARESLSVTYGGWELWYPGYTDGGNWIPVEPEFTPGGPDARLLTAYREEDLELVRGHLAQAPDEVRLKALYICGVLRRYDLFMLKEGESEDPEVRARVAKKIEIAGRLIPDAIEIASEGERQDPDNAFFPIAQAIAHEQLGNRALASAAAGRAAECGFYNDYSYELSRLYEAHLSPNAYDRFYGRLVGGSGFLWEIRKLGRRWSNSGDANELQLRKHIVDLCPLLAASASTSIDVSTVRTIVKDCAVTSEEFKRQYDMGRHPNDGDLYRTLTNTQNEMIAAGQIPMVDMPAFYAVDGYVDLSNYGIDDADGFDLQDQGWRALLSMEAFVVLGASALYALVVLAGYFALAFLLSKMISFSVPERGFASLAALLLAALDLAIGNAADGLAPILICFAASFACSFWPKLAIASVCLGVSGCIFAILREVYIAEYPQWARANVPVSAFLIGVLRYYRLIGKPRSKGVWLTLPLVVFLVWGVTDLRFKTFGWHDVGLGAIVLPLALVLISLWHQVQLSEACKKVLRSIPIATLIAVLMFGFCAFRQYLLVKEMADLTRDQESMVANWKEEVAKVGPPIVGIATQ